MKRLFTKNFTLVITLLLLTTSFLSGCDKHSADSDLEEITIVLDWYPNAIHAFIYEAIEKGYYVEEDLNVKIEFPSNTNDAISLTAAGKADVGMYYHHDVIMARTNQDIPIKAIGSITQNNLNVVLSLKEHGITSPADLEGKKIGYAGTVLSETFVRQMLEFCGKSMDDVQMIDVGFDLMSSMTTKNVDATIGCMVNHELPQLKEEGFEINSFAPTDYGVPKYYELVLVTGEKQLKNNSEKLEKFLRASKKGFADMKANPEEALNILLEYQNEENFPLSRTVEEQSMEYLLPAMETDTDPFLTQEEAIWQDNIDWLYEQKVISSKLQASEFFINLID